MSAETSSCYLVVERGEDFPAAELARLLMRIADGDRVQVRQLHVGSPLLLELAADAGALGVSAVAVAAAARQVVRAGARIIALPATARAEFERARRPLLEAQLRNLQLEQKNLQERAVLDQLEREARTIEGAEVTHSRDRGPEPPPLGGLGR